MAEQTPTRFDDILLEAAMAIQAIVRGGAGWAAADPREKDRAVEIRRGLAGERRYARQVANVALVVAIDALRTSSAAQLRMLEGRTTPGDEELAARFDADVIAYGVATGRSSADAPP